MDTFIDASNYEEFVATGRRIRANLESLARWEGRQVVIHRMYYERDVLMFCFSVNDVRYLIKAPVTLMMGEKTEWTIQCNQWSKGAEPIESFDLIHGTFIKPTDKPLKKKKGKK